MYTHLYIVCSVFKTSGATFVFFCCADQNTLLALRCLALLFAPMKTKKLEENIPYIMKVVPVSCAHTVSILCTLINTPTYEVHVDLSVTDSL